jgi:hypothetical protein
MSRVILEFNLPEESEEFDHAHKGSMYLLALEDIQNFLRSKLKYAELTDEQVKIYEGVQEKIFEAREKWGV